MADCAKPARRRAWDALTPAIVMLVIIALSASVADARTRRLHPIDLGTLGGSNSFAIGINPAGTLIVGESDNVFGQVRPVLWRGGRIIDLGTPESLGAADGLDANNSDVIVGTYGQTDNPAATQHGFSWHDGRLRILPGLPGGGATSARRINRHGEIAGSAFTADGHEHPALWGAGGVHDLGLPPGYTDGYLLGLNDAGDAGGAMFGAHGREAAFTWHDAHFRVLPTLGGPTAQVNVLDNRSVAAGIADVDTNGTSEATLWGSDGAAHGLGFFPGSNFSWVLGTNGFGDYTGIASLSLTDPLPHVFVAHAGGRLLALPLLSGDYATNPSVAHGIDNKGDVVGASNNASGNAHATLWPDAFDQAFRPPVTALSSRSRHARQRTRAAASARHNGRARWLGLDRRPGSDKRAAASRSHGNSLGCPPGRIVFTQLSADGIPNIFSIDACGRHSHQLTPSGGHHADLSPDGQQLAFDTLTPGAGTLTTDVFTLNLTTTSPVNRSNAPDRNDTRPAWSRDGRHLAYASAVNGSRQSQIFVVDLASGHQHPITPILRDQEPLDPSWSPDGRQIVFDSEIFPAGPSHLWVVRADGTGLHMITSDTRDAWGPDWGANGLITFADGANAEQSHVWVMRPDGTDQQQLTADDGGGSSALPAFSPDGRWITYTHFATTGDTHVWRMQGSGAGKTDLTPDAHAASWSDWGPSIP